MPVNIGGYKIEPAPLVSIGRQYTRTPATKKLSALFTLTITGKICADRGSPQGGSLGGSGWGGPGGLWWTTSGPAPPESVSWDKRLGSIEKKQEALRSAFSVDGQWLEFQSPDGQAPLKAQVRVNTIEFAPAIWFNDCDYTITCDADSLSLLGNDSGALEGSDLITSASESWQIEEGEINRTYRISHTATATARDAVTGGPGYVAAKDFVENYLMVGYTSASTFSTLTGQTFVGSVSNFAALSANPLYNYTTNSVINEVDGTYTVNESWTVSTLIDGIETYTVQVKNISDEINTTTVVTLQGSIKGFYVDFGDYDTRFTKAQAVWATVGTTVLYSRASAQTSATLDPKPVLSELTYNQFDGTISYNYAFSNKAYNGEAVDTYTISQSSQIDDYKSTFSIEGIIEGRRYETDTIYTTKFDRAYAIWNTINSPANMFGRLEVDGYLAAYSDIRTNPIDQNVTFNKNMGTIQYSFKFDNRQNDNDTNDENVRETYTVSQNYSRDDGLTFYTIAGTVEGLSVVVGDARNQKWLAAYNYYTGTTLPALLTRIANYGGVITNTAPVSIEVEKNPTIGTITYSYKYSTQSAPCVAGALTEVVTISYSNASSTVNIYADIPIPGRTQGPVLQDMATTAKKTVTLEIEAVLPPQGNCSYSASAALKPNTNSLVSQVRPTANQVFCDEDQETWAWRTGRYTRHVQWSYQ